LNEVQDLLGHASIATTQIYVHASAARLEGAVMSLPDVLDVNV
jgi:integrase/recombinase XerD